MRGYDETRRPILDTRGGRSDAERCGTVVAWPRDGGRRHKGGWHGQGLSTTQIRSMRVPHQGEPSHIKANLAAATTLRLSTSGGRNGGSPGQFSAAVAHGVGVLASACVPESRWLGIAVLQPLSVWVFVRC